jgi:hypothetical protein
MDELRVVRRDDQSLIVANEAGDEYRLLVDSSVLADLRHLARQASGGARINPREIQSLVRAGKTRAEIMELTGAEDSDIERYEEPVLAERRFILTSAQSVAVRTSPSDPTEDHFGAVIAERLIGLSAKKIEWSSWRDDEAGWMISLDFVSHEVSHHAVWSFEHRKGLLSPLTPDAVSLSKQGEVGDRLIPKLRAVGSSKENGRFDSDAFDREELLEGESAADAAGASAVPNSTPDSDPEPSDDILPAVSALSAGAEAAVRSGHPSTASIPVVASDDEFARRREIDQRAIKTPEPEAHDLGQTADLLDALRRRRGARDSSSALTPQKDSDAEHPSAPVQQLPLRGLGEWRETEANTAVETQSAEEAQETQAPHDKQQSDSAKSGKRRTSIPSWDDILFGTRSEEDPS